ncbi:MAG TPA: outer membrane protein assembly factor BamC [Acidiferrobacterales bacterium]
MTLFTATLLAGCTLSTKPERRADVRPPLEVPPDLVAPETNSALVVPEAVVAEPGAAAPPATAALRPDVVVGQPVLPNYDGIRLERAGGQRWLTLDAPPARVWDLAHQFLQRKGLTIERESRQSGVMETDWVDYRPVPGSALERGKSSVLGMLHSTGLRDKYRVRLEIGKEPNTTEVYLSHRGMEEVVASNNPTGVIQTMWQPRASDPELEVELLRQFLVFVGMNEQRATDVVTAKPEGARAGMALDPVIGPVLRVEDGIDNSWRRVGLSLDRLGWLVEDRDRSQWTYRVRHVTAGEKKKRGGLFGWLVGDDEAKETVYLVKLKDATAWTEVSIRDAKGLPVTQELAEGVLQQLERQLR